MAMYIVEMIPTSLPSTANYKFLNESEIFTLMQFIVVSLKIYLKKERE